MSENSHQLGENERLSVNYLNQVLNEGGIFAYSQHFHSHWENIVQDKIDRRLSDAGVQHGVPEKCVLVGQSINIATLQNLVEKFFKKARYIVLRAHHLHQEFSQQALLLEIYSTTNDNAKNPKKLLTKETLLAISKQYFVDCFEMTNIQLMKPGLIVMDMDSTIINMECIDEIAALAGVGDKVSELTERAMLGELDFNQSLQARLSCLKGIKLDELETLKSRLPINPGFAVTIKYLQSKGWVTCIASGGFTYFANYLKDTYDLSYAFSNELSLTKGVLNGTVTGDIVNAEMKKQILLETRQSHNIDAQQTIAIGDGANDLLMMQAAALGVAYKAKPKVQLAADANIHYCGFEGLLYCLQA